MPSYWEQRAIDSIGRMEKAVNGQIPDLVKAFEAAKRDLNDQVGRFFVRYAKNNKISLADAQKQLSLSELREFRGNLAEFEQLARNSIGTFNLQVDNLSVKARATRLEALQAQCDAILQRLYQEQRDQIAGTSADIYTSEYYHQLFDIEQYTGFQFPYSGPDASAVRKVIEQPVYGMDLSEHLWRQDIDAGFKIRQTLTNMFVTGRPPQDFADKLQKQIGAVRVKPDGIAAGTGKKYEAYRLLYTESAHVTNQAQLQACNDDGIDEFEDIVTLDSHTCPYCAGFDGKHYPVSKAIEGVNCPPWHPFCRCTTAPYIPDLDDLSSTRASRDPVTGKTMPTAAQTYDEWKAQQDAKYGAGTVDIERKKVQNEASDFKQYQRMKPVLKENSPKSFAEFQNLKYNKPDDWEDVKYYARNINGRPIKYVKIDRELEKLGIVNKGKAYPVEPIEIKGWRGHAEKRLLQRGITKEQAASFMNQAKIMMKQYPAPATLFNYYSKSGILGVKADSGIVQTTFGKDDFMNDTLKIFEVIKKYVK